MHIKEIIGEYIKAKAALDTMSSSLLIQLTILSSFFLTLTTWQSRTSTCSSTAAKTAYVLHVSTFLNTVIPRVTVLAISAATCQAPLTIPKPLSLWGWCLSIVLLMLAFIGRMLVLLCLMIRFRNTGSVERRWGLWVWHWESEFHSSV